MNYLEAVESLRNRYYALRHGRSLANDLELIVSHPDDAVADYGLTGEGRRQVAAAIGEALRDRTLDATTLIVTSDYARARESAEIAREVLGSQEVVLAPQLRERYFGEWDGGHHANYRRVWAADAEDSAHTQHGVESAEQVLARATSLIAELESRYSGRSILLVSHGDTLQILQTAFERVPASTHRSLRHLATGGARALLLRAKM